FRGRTGVRGHSALLALVTLLALPVLPGSPARLRLAPSAWPVWPVRLARQVRLARRPGTAPALHTLPLVRRRCWRTGASWPWSA
ncbi:hypothetical protein, partial [Catenulispora pinisilvae]|uniref:hypothetical protein n=1 Tax=Catenulispora pinisilvae TaxID=2705253 RepID=UPI001E2F5C6D